MYPHYAALHLLVPLPLTLDPALTSIMLPRLHPDDEFAGMISGAFYFQSWSRCAAGSLSRRRRKTDPECGQQLVAQPEPTAPKRCPSQEWQQENLAQLVATLTVQKISALQPLAAGLPGDRQVVHLPQDTVSPKSCQQSG